MVGVTGSIPVAPTSLRLLRKRRLPRRSHLAKADSIRIAHSQATARQAKPNSIVAKQAKAAAPKPLGEGGLHPYCSFASYGSASQTELCRSEASEGCRAEATWRRRALSVLLIRKLRLGKPNRTLP